MSVGRLTLVLKNKHVGTEYQAYIYLINHVGATAMTTGWMTTIPPVGTSTQK